MTDAERKAYSRGYVAGLRGRWPEHKPALPPHELLRELMQKCIELRDSCDHACALFDEGDEFTKRLSPAVDAMDSCMTKITEWLKDES